MKFVRITVFSLVALALVGAIIFFAIQGMNEAERLGEQKNADVTQQQSEIDSREAAKQQEKAALDQALKSCVAESDKQYVDGIEDAKKNKQFPSQEAADNYVKQLQQIRSANIEGCQQQYDAALEQFALEIVP
jgi:preprotein translocase subunit SecF